MDIKKTFLAISALNRFVKPSGSRISNKLRRIRHDKRRFQFDKIKFGFIIISYML